jgi:hypothetical protein
MRSRHNTALTKHLEHFRARVVQDALNEASAAYWLRRADAYEQASRPRPAEWIGFHTTPAERAARRQRLQETAAACRARAHVALIDGRIEEDVWAALTETTQQADTEPYRPAA